MSLTPEQTPENPQTPRKHSSAVWLPCTAPSTTVTACATNLDNDSPKRACFYGIGLPVSSFHPAADERGPLSLGTKVKTLCWL